jgi:hypothetical protein
VKYKVWHPDSSDESRARTIEACFIYEAAQEAALFSCSSDWGGPRVYHVRDEAGRLWAVEVRLDLEPVFYAGPPVRLAEQP